MRLIECLSPHRLLFFERPDRLSRRRAFFNDEVGRGVLTMWPPEAQRHESSLRQRVLLMSHGETRTDCASQWGETRILVSILTSSSGSYTRWYEIFVLLEQPHARDPWEDKLWRCFSIQPGPLRAVFSMHSSEPRLRQISCVRTLSD